MKRYLLKSPFLPMLVAILAHSIGLLNDFVMDDFADIVSHPVVNGKLPFWRMIDFNYMGESLDQGHPTFRILTSWVFAIEWKLWSGRAIGFHATSILFFLFNIVLVQKTFKLFFSEKAAMLGALLFASLGIHVGSIAGAAHRAEIQALCLSLLALLWGIRSRYFLAIVAYIAAMMSKESATLMPLLLVAYWWSKEGFSSLAPKRKGFLAILLLVTGFVFVLFRSWWIPITFHNVAAPDNPLFHQEIATRIWGPLVLLGKYLSLTFIPADFTVDYTYSAIPINADLTNPLGWFGLSFFLLSVFVFWRFHFIAPEKRTRLQQASMFAVGSFYASYLIISNSVLLITVLMAERLFFAPSLWVLMLVFIMGMALYEHYYSLRRLLLFVVALVLLMQVPASVLRTLEWQSDRTLWRSVVRTQPNNVRGHYYLSRQLANGAKQKEAIWHLSLALLGRNHFPSGFSTTPLGTGLRKWNLSSARFVKRASTPWKHPLTLAQRKLPIEQKLLMIPKLLSPKGKPLDILERLKPMVRGLLGKKALEELEALIVRVSDNTPG